MYQIADIAKSVIEVASPGMKPKELLAAVRAIYPEASKKEITRAAFYAVLEMSEDHSEKAHHIHGLATDTRNSIEESAPA